MSKARRIWKFLMTDEVSGRKSKGVQMDVTFSKCDLNENMITNVSDSLSVVCGASSVVRNAVALS
jgi:hypothetical protein